MSQSQELLAGGGGNGGNTSFSTGAICPKTGLYKTFDGRIEIIEYYSAGDAFRTGPGGNGTKKCSWTRVTLATDGGKTSYEAVKVTAGTI